MSSKWTNEDLVRIVNGANKESAKAAQEELRKRLGDPVQDAIDAKAATVSDISHEQMCEMRNAFGEGATVVNVITGRKIQL